MASCRLSNSIETNASQVLGSMRVAVPLGVRRAESENTAGVTGESVQQQQQQQERSTLDVPSADSLSQRGRPN